MISGGPVHLVRASGFGPLPKVFEHRAGEFALWRAFEQQGLPVEVIGAPQTPIPIRSMIGLFEHCAHVLGERTFGLDVGFEMAKAWGFGLWGQYGVSAPTLGEAIARYNKTFWAHSRGGRLELAKSGDYWLWRCVGRSIDVATTQHSDHMIGPMLIIAREFLGQKWAPDWMEVNYRRDPDAYLLEDRLQVPVHFGCRGTGMVFTSENLHARPVRTLAGTSGIITLREVAADIVLADTPEPARSLSAIVALRLLEGRTDIEGTARMAGISVRSLQRRLMQKGHTYREIVSGTRKARALSLLRETDLAIVEIAMLLGYEDHASFTRAFQRWMGCSPLEFRRHRRTVLAQNAKPTSLGFPRSR